MWRLKKNYTAKTRDIAPFKVNGQSHIILQQLSCGTRSKVSLFLIQHKTTLATSFVSSDMYFTVFYMYVSVFILLVKLTKIN